MESVTTDRKRWRSSVDGLCSQRAKRHKSVSKSITLLLQHGMQCMKHSCVQFHVNDIVCSKLLSHKKRLLSEWK